MKLTLIGVTIACTVLAIVTLLRGDTARSTNFIAWAVLNAVLALHN